MTLFFYMLEPGEKRWPLLIDPAYLNYKNKVIYVEGEWRHPLVGSK